MVTYKAVEATCTKEIARIIIVSETFDIQVFNNWLSDVTNHGLKAIEKNGILCFVNTGEKQYTAIPGIEQTGERRFRICEISHRMIIRKI